MGGAIWGRRKMKKWMWAISIFSLVLTMAVLQFMPDSVPMHYDMAGNIDRWGSKYENLLFPVIILFLSLLWHLFAAYYEKKAANASVEKERAEALSNAKVLKIVGASMAAMFTVMQGFILYSAYVEAGANAAQAYMDIGKIPCILNGAVLIILGNYLPKTRKNDIVGVRIRWSMYNDTTWRKSNRFGGIAMMIAGLSTIIAAIFVKLAIAVAFFLVSVLITVTVTLIYSNKVYKSELSKSDDSVS